MNTKYNKKMYEVYLGKGNDEIEKENKIIGNIAKNVTIDIYFFKLFYIYIIFKI